MLAAGAAKGIVGCFLACVAYCLPPLYPKEYQPICIILAISVPLQDAVARLGHKAAGFAGMRKS